jgi:two-component sensor histidine kinase
LACPARGCNGEAGGREWRGRKNPVVSGHGGVSSRPMETVLARVLSKQRLPLALRYAATLVIVLVAALARLGLGVPLAQYPLILFFPAVFLSALLFDSGSGYLATLVSAGLAVFMTSGGGSLPATAWDMVVPLLIFVAIGAMMTAIIEALRGAVKRLTAAEGSKSLLLEELGHRTKNDLAIIASALRLQMRASREPGVHRALEAALLRVEVIARAQDRLRDGAEAGLVDLPLYIRSLCDGLHALMQDVRPIVIKVRCAPLKVAKTKAVAVGLIVNELVVNALKYAFPDERTGTVEVDIVVEGEPRRLRISVADDGVGCEAEPPAGLGSRLVRTLAQQHGGGVERRDGANGLTVVATLLVEEG